MPIDREEYWNNNYLNYWKERVDEANVNSSNKSTVIDGDTTTSTDELYKYAISLLNIRKTDQVLEIACGFGRALSTLCDLAKHVTATDISKEMITVAKKENNIENISFYTSPSESMPFDDNVYNSIICFAAFDAMYQEETLIEMNRVCKLGGKVLITGKNDNYFDDDKLALDAEIGARNKNHPNYFTDVKKLVNSINDFGFLISLEEYHLKRGDFVNNKALLNLPEKFYEYLFVLTKISTASVDKEFSISNKYSKCFRNKKEI